MNFHNLLSATGRAAATPSNSFPAPVRARMTNYSAGWGSVEPWPTADGG